MSTENNETSGPSGYEGHADNQRSDNADDSAEQIFECNICLETAKDAVISVCGHLFCWPCLHQWFETRPGKQLCPVCKAGLSRDKVIPLYGRGGSNQDPRDKIPPRPSGQRPEPQNINNGYFPGFGFGDGFHVSFGVGTFPFTLFTQSFSFGNVHGAYTPQTGSAVLSVMMMLLTAFGATGFLLMPLLSTLLIFLPGFAGFDIDMDDIISKLFLWIAAIFILWILFT